MNTPFQNSTTIKEPQVRTTAHNATTPSTPKTGLLALLGSLLHINGTGASKITLRLILSVLATTLGALAFASAPALAAGGHVFASSFAVPDPTGIAINNATGNVYVVDKADSRVEEFNPAGTKLEAEFNGSGTPGALSEPEAIAIDNSGETVAEDPSVGDVYVTDHSVIDKFEADGKHLGQITEAEGAAFATLEGVAVDPRGQLWVYQENGRIDAFSDASSNVFLSSVPSQGISTPPDPGLAVNSEDDLYVAHGEEGEGEVQIAKLKSNGEVLEPQLGGIHGKTGVAVEAASNDVYIDSGNPENGAPEIQEFTSGGAPIETFDASQLVADHGGKALAVSYANISRGDVYVVDSVTGEVDIFTLPKVTAHVFASSFGKEGAGAGEFADPTGVAVNDETGDAYAVDKGNNRIDEFAENGTFVRAWGWDVVPGGLGGFETCGPAAIPATTCQAGAPGTGAGQLDAPEAIAVDNHEGSPSKGDVYVTNTAENVVDKFSATGEYKGQITGTCEAENEVPPACEPSKTFIPFAPLVGIAVDANGVVWVAQRSRAGHTGEIDAFNGEEPNGFLSRREPQTGGSDLPHPGFAVDSADNLYVTLERAAGDLVAKLNNEGQALETSGAEDFCGQPSGLRTGVAVDLSSEDVLLDYGTSIGECAASGSPLESFGSGHLTGGSGLAANASSGAVYVADSTANDVDIFDEEPMAQVAVGAGSALTSSSVTLEGEVDPEGKPVSSCEFEYGTSTAYDQTAECEPAAGSLGEGTKAKPVTAKLKGLSSGTTYHYRLVASSTVGTNRSADFELKTLGPEIAAEEFNYVEATNVTLNAQIDPNGSATSYHFEYDTSPYAEGEGPHGTDLPAPSASLGSGKSPVPVSVKAQGLRPGTTYYFRVVAESALQGAPHLFDGASKTFTTSPASSTVSCTNEQLRAEQPFGLTLPDCRAYELVSPEETGGQDAVDSFNDANARAAESSASPAITYASQGSFGNPTGAAATDQFVSRRNAANDRWETQAITPLLNPIATENFASFDATVFEPELEAGIAATDAALPSTGAPGGEEPKLYVSDFATGSYRYVGSGLSPLGASTDLSQVVFGAKGEVSEWVDGRTLPVSVTNEGTNMGAAVGSAVSSFEEDLNAEHDAWHAVSSDGSRVYFTSPGQGSGQLYLRENAEQEQSPLTTQGEASGTGTLTADSREVTSLVTATGTVYARAGSTQVELNAQGQMGEFVVGDTVTGEFIEPETTITAINGGHLTLSKAITGNESGGAGDPGNGFQLSDIGPGSFAVGQTITGAGIPPGTTITEAKAGKLTLSKEAGSSSSDVALKAAGECSVPADACTIEVSAAQRVRANPAGTQPARYWGASADGSKVFFTSNAELTEDAYTGTSAENSAANLYEYDLATGKLNDLTGEALDGTGNGAAVQGVVQISEKGQYVYFVAKGVLTGEEENQRHEKAKSEEDNLYVSYEGRAPTFIATLAAGDESDWDAEGAEGGPEINTAVVNPGGTRLAFLSTKELTGYDNQDANTGNPDAEIFLYEAGAGSPVCASCNPTGARPVGQASFVSDQGKILGSALYRPRNLLADGTLFFDSSDALVPNAKDGRQNVYEYEHGHVYAISNVAGGEESFFLDASPSGEDVFFGSTNKLLPQDTGDNVVVWDARQDGGFPVPPAAPSCDNGDSCKPPPSSQPGVFAPTGSATANGLGDFPPPAAVVKPKSKPLTRAQKLAAALKSCRKDKKKSKRQKCESQARAKYGTGKKAKKASHHRRTHS
jgi:DNA-binding beta-propeller fold protein YncE